MNKLLLFDWKRYQNSIEQIKIIIKNLSFESSDTWQRRIKNATIIFYILAQKDNRQFLIVCTRAFRNI